MWRSRRSAKRRSRSCPSCSRHGKRFLRTEPLKAMVIGAFVRGLSMRDVESLCEEAGLGKMTKSTRRGSARSCASGSTRSGPRPLGRQAGRAVPGRDLAAGPALRPEGRRDVRLGDRRDRRAGAGFGEAGDARVPRGLARARSRPDRPRAPCPRLVVVDGAPGLNNAIEEIWPRADRQHCTVHRLRNVLAKLPERERERIRQLLVSARRGDSVRDGKRRMRALIGELADQGYEPPPVPRRRPRCAGRAPALPAPAPRSGDRRTCSSAPSGRSAGGPR